MIPTDVFQQVSQLISGASAAKNVETQAVYLAAARSLLEDQRRRVEQVAALVSRAETDLVRASKLAARSLTTGPR